MNTQSTPARVPIALLGVLAAGGAWGLSSVLAGDRLPAIALAPVALAAAGLGLCLFVSAAAGSRRGVAALLVLVAFGLSISFRIREYGDTGIDMQNGIKLVVWLLIPAIALLNLGRIRRLFGDPVMALAGLHALVAMASFFWSGTPAYTGASALGVASYLLLACLAVTILDDRMLLKLLVIVFASYAVLSLISAGLLPDRAWLMPTGYVASERLQGLSGHPNVLGEQMAVLITLAVIARRQRLISAPAFVVCLCLGFAVLEATSSRTMLAAVLLAWAVVALRQKGLLLVALAAVGVAASAFILAMALGYDPVPEAVLASMSRSGNTSELATLTGRTELWQIALDLIRERPLLGWGYNGTEALFVDNAGRAFYGDPVNAHNMYLQSLVSLGLLGSLPAAAMFALLVTRMVAEPDPARDQIVLLVLIIGFAEVGVAATPVVLMLVFFIFLARDAVRHRRFSPASTGLQRHGLPRTSTA